MAPGAENFKMASSWDDAAATVRGDDQTIANKRRSQLSNRVALVNFIWVSAVFLGLFIWCFELAKTQMSWMQNRDEIAGVIIGVAAATLVLVLSIAVFVALHWNTPEIKAIGRPFVVQFLLGACTGNTMRIILTTYTIGPTVNSKFGTSEYAIVTQAMTWIEWVGICMAFSAIALRQRLMYLIFAKRSLRPNYYGGIPFHLILFLISLLPVIINSACCGWYTRQWYRGTAVYIYLFPITAQMGYYTWKCRGQTNYFHSFASNVRIFSICVVVVMSWSLFLQLSNTRFQHKWIAGSTFGSFIVGPYYIWVALLETFTLPVLTLIFRRLGKGQWLDQYDFGHDAQLAAIQDATDLEQILEDPELRHSFVSFCASQNPTYKNAADFLVGTRNVRNCNDAAKANGDVRALVAKHVASDAPNPVPLTESSRRNAIKACEGTQGLSYNTIHALDEETQDYLRIHALNDFRRTKEYRNHIKKMATPELQTEVQIALQRGGLVKPNRTSSGDDVIAMSEAGLDGKGSSKAALGHGGVGSLADDHVHDV